MIYKFPFSGSKVRILRKALAQNTAVNTLLVDGVQIET